MKIVLEIKVQMIGIMEHFISCTWAAHFDTMLEELIKPYLADVSTLDYVLKGDSIKESKGNVIRGETGAKIFPELYFCLSKVQSPNIKNYLKKEFKNYQQPTI